MFTRIRLLVEYAPLLGYAQEIVNTDDLHKRMLLVMEAAELLANRSDTTVDDDVLRLISAVLESEEGEALFHYIVDSLKGLTDE